MAWTNWGFDGTINEAQWSQMAGLLGNGYVAAGDSDCLVTAVAGARSVSVAAGTLYGDGVVSVNSAPETVAMTTPVNGQWYVIALRRTWSSNTAALVAIAGATTSTSTPTAPPTSFPTLNTNQGVLTDQPIAWAWCNSANTTVVVYDIRLKAVKSLPPVVASQAERDAKFMTPTQGLQVWRNDLGTVQTYFGAYNSSTNPGGRDSGGWFSNDRRNGLVPIQPSAVTIATGSGSANALGVVSFTGATGITLQNVLSAEFQHYKIIVNISSATALAVSYLRYAVGSTPVTSSLWYVTGNYWGQNGSGASTVGSGAAEFNIGVPAASGYSNLTNLSEITLTRNTAMVSYVGFPNGFGGSVSYGRFNGSGATHDGIHIYPGSGNITGTIQIFGYND